MTVKITCFPCSHSWKTCALRPLHLCQTTLSSAYQEEIAGRKNLIAKSVFVQVAQEVFTMNGRYCHCKRN